MGTDMSSSRAMPSTPCSRTEYQLAKEGKHKVDLKPDRGRFLSWAWAGLAVVALARGACFADAASGEVREGRAADGDRPNIVFIMADDLGYADLGCYGQKHVKTPCIDQMAREGLKFTQCYTGAVVCAPSRSVLMTGQHTGHTRVRGNKGDNTPPHNGQNGRIPLRPEDFTVAKLLQNAGYRTGITGKWGLGEPGSTGLPNDHGFDEWLGYLNQDHAPDYFTDFLWRNKKRSGPSPRTRTRNAASTRTIS